MTGIVWSGDTMKLLNARIKGFQSFADSGDIRFEDGINLLVGQNNAGKSAFLRALQSSLTDDRHRSPAVYEEHRLPQPEVDLTVEVTGSELRDTLLQSVQQHHFPVIAIDPLEAKKEIDEILDNESLSFNITSRPGKGFISKLYPSHQLLEIRHPMSAVIQNQHGQLVIVAIQGVNNDTLPIAILELWQREMFFFSAERFAIGQAAHQHASRLLPDASNLPAVLHTLMGDRGALFERLVLHLREIFPTVGNLSVRPSQIAANMNEIRVWPTERMDRVELSFPLKDGGTGVAQVVAMLTAIMTLDKAVILIDEINSFLHPAAAKALLRIIQTHYPHHQYVISTHAPEVIAFSNPTTIHLIKRSGYDTSIEALNLDAVESFRDVANHLGVSMTDVFAADRIIWVEGPTEELCFAYIYNRFFGGLPRGLIITSVAATGDFNRKRDREIVYQVYQRLSSASASLVVSVAFSFDTELLTDAERAGMQRESKGHLHFLPRRHLECYLIDPAAIAAFIASSDPQSAGLTEETVTERLKAISADGDLHIASWSNDLQNEAWLSGVDAANLISRTCSSLSDYRVTFSKKHDSLALLQHISHHRPEQLSSLAAYVKQLVDAVPAAVA